MKYRARRRATSFGVTVNTELGKGQADIVDVTDRGARLRLETGLAPGSPITVNLHGKGRAATVKWSNGREAGVAFDELLPLDVLAAVNRSMHRPAIKAGNETPRKG